MPTTMAFLGDDDILVLEKETGRVRRVMNGAITSTVLDLAVNFGSERGLLGIALHPEFPTNPGVYLFWTESTTGSDTSVLSATPLLGNRVDRFTWDGATLTLDRNIIMLRAIQQDADQAVSAATTTVECSGLGPMASSISFSAIRVGVANCRIFRTGRLGPANRTISLAARNQTMRTLAALSYA